MILLSYILISRCRFLFTFYCNINLMLLESFVLGPKILQSIKVDNGVNHLGMWMCYYQTEERKGKFTHSIQTNTGLSSGNPF